MTLYLKKVGNSILNNTSPFNVFGPVAFKFILEQFIVEVFSVDIVFLITFNVLCNS